LYPHLQDPSDGTSRPLIIATIPREQGITGVHTHVRQLRAYLERSGHPVEQITPYSWGSTPVPWGRAVIGPIFALRLVLERLNGSVNVWWYRHWHEVFLYRALRARLASIGSCVVYAQCPLSARAALRARRGPNQRVVLAVHFRISQADEWADKGQISRVGRIFRGIRSLESDVIPQVDGLVYVSDWAQKALTAWLPRAAGVPSTVIDNFVTAPGPDRAGEPRGDLVTVGNLEAIKNHRYLLQILAEAKRMGRTFTLDVFGEGPQLSDLVALERSLGLQGQVRWHGFRRDVRAALPGYRAYTHASYSESSSLAIIEAMAAGLPVLAGNIGPLAELFDDGVEGRFWPLDNPTRAAELLIDLVNSEPERLRAAGAARARFARDFDADVIAPRLVSFLIAAPDPAPARVRSGRFSRE
jgi:glycosyltransferase involved in cell wall biosynthesis